MLKVSSNQSAGVTRGGHRHAPDVGTVYCLGGKAAALMIQAAAGDGPLGDGEKGLEEVEGSNQLPTFKNVLLEKALEGMLPASDFPPKEVHP